MFDEKCQLEKGHETLLMDDLVYVKERAKYYKDLLKQCNKYELLCDSDSD